MTTLASKAWVSVREYKFGPLRVVVVVHRDGSKDRRIALGRWIILGIDDRERRYPGDDGEQPRCRGDECSEALRNACAILDRWRRELGLSAEDVLFYGEYSGLARREFGDRWLELFIDGKTLEELLELLGLAPSKLEETCKSTGSD